MSFAWLCIDRTQQLEANLSSSELCKVLLSQCEKYKQHAVRGSLVDCGWHGFFQPCMLGVGGAACRDLLQTTTSARLARPGWAGNTRRATATRKQDHKQASLPPPPSSPEAQSQPRRALRGRAAQQVLQRPPAPRPHFPDRIQLFISFLRAGRRPTTGRCGRERRITAS
jgi:hypothetical protein